MDLGIIADDHQGSHPDAALPPGATLSFANLVDLDNQQALSAATRAVAATAADEAASSLFRQARLPPALPALHPPHHDDPISQYELPALGATASNNAILSLFAPLPPTVDTTSTTAASGRGRPRSTAVNPMQPRPGTLPGSLPESNPLRFSWNESDHPEVEIVGDLIPVSSQIPQPLSAAPGTPPLPLSVAPPVVTTTATTMTATMTATAATTAPVESRKRKRSSEAASPPDPTPAASSTRVPPPDDDSNCCSICLENWSNSGDHQICCLPCGHLFGRKCIMTWLRKKKLCPSCKQNAKGKDVRLIFGAPTYLAVQDEGDLAKLRNDLEKEIAEHSKTKRKLEDAKMHAASLSRRLSNISQPSIRTFGHQNSRQFSRQNSLSRQNSRSMAQQQSRPGPILGVSPVVSSTVQTATSSTMGVPRRVHVAEMARVGTNGVSKALAFDNSGNVLFGEKRHARQNDYSPQHVSRTPLANTALRTTSRAEFLGRILDLSVCRNMDNYHSCVAVANQVRRLHILSPSLDEVMSYNTPAVPLSCLWMASQPHLVISGLVNGMVCAFDIRMSGSSPLYTGKIHGPASCAVHSLAEIPLYNSNQTMLLAASPSRIDAASFNPFSGNMTLEEVQRDGPSQIEHCSSLCVDRDQVLITTRQANSTHGRHSIFPGLIPVMNLNDELTPIATPDNRTLHFGRANACLEGHRLMNMFEPTALVAGDGTDGTVVLSGDVRDNIRSTRVWEQRGQQGAEWTSAEVAPMASTPGSVIVRSYTLPQNLNVHHQDARMRAIAGHLSDACLQLFAVTRAPLLL